MFTGIITDLGRIRAVERRDDTRMVVETRFPTEEIAIGASVACSGACLTVVERGPGWFAVDVSDETLSCTTLADWRVGTKVNLERALRVGDELGGHLVTGHVDGVGAIAARTPTGGSIVFSVDFPTELRAYIAAKGSIAVDGVSLTVNHVAEDRFSVNIVPHTQQETTFGVLEPGARVNLEVDMLARYVSRYLSATRG
ncbi:MAG: riboflavin synthase [Rhodospirillaceae bacterium]|nr:riboflavin synthase [Rhodospirillaceae bacterium]